MKAFVVLATVLACASAKPGPAFVSTYGGFPYSAAVAPAAYTTAYQTTAYHGAAYSPYAAAPIQYSAAAPIQYTSAVAAPAFVAPAFSKTQYHAQDELGQASYGYAHPGQAHSAVRDAAGNVRGAYAYINPDGNEIRVNYVADAGGFRVESNALPQAPVHIIPPQAAGPAPVLDTPEVVEARAAHFRAHEEVKLRSLRKKRGVVAAAPVAYAAGPVAYSGAYPALGYNALAAPALGYSAVAAPAFGYSTLASPAYNAYGYNGAYSALGYSGLGYNAAYPAHGYSGLGYNAAYPALGYSGAAVIPTHAVREATLTKVVNTPGHAVSYRVD